MLSWVSPFNTNISEIKKHAHTYTNTVSSLSARVPRNQSDATKTFQNCRDQSPRKSLSHRGATETSTRCQRRQQGHTRSAGSAGVSRVSPSCPGTLPGGSRRPSSLRPSVGRVGSGTAWASAVSHGNRSDMGSQGSGGPKACSGGGGGRLQREKVRR